jgi:hypothetical protein
MNKRPKYEEERLEDLRISLSTLAREIRYFYETHEIGPLRSIATQLRALIVRDGTSFRHPLFFELAEAKGFALTVYVLDTSTKDTPDTGSLPEGQKARRFFYASGSVMRLQPDDMFAIKITLQDAMEMVHARLGEEELSLKQVIRLIADTEAAHYDNYRPIALDKLNSVLKAVFLLLIG